MSTTHPIKRMKVASVPAKSIIAYIAAGSATDLGDNNELWTLPNRAEGAPNNLTATNSINAGGITNTLTGHFDFSSLPAVVGIIGIEIALYDSSINGAAFVRLHRVQWRDASGWIGRDLGSNVGINRYAVTAHSVGGPREKWGLDLTRAMVVDPDFDIAVQYAAAPGAASIALLDAIQATLYYDDRPVL